LRPHRWPAAYMPWHLRQAKTPAFSCRQ
jgi:hypothetical protein